MYTQISLHHIDYSNWFYTYEVHTHTLMIIYMDLKQHMNIYTIQQHNNENSNADAVPAPAAATAAAAAMMNCLGSNADAQADLYQITRLFQWQPNGCSKQMMYHLARPQRLQGGRYWVQHLNAKYYHIPNASPGVGCALSLYGLLVVIHAAWAS